MRPQVVYTKAAPKTGFSGGMESPFAQGVKCGQFLFVSGQGPLDALTKEGVQPARITVEASALRKGVNVEIDCIAWIP
jgi:enamine deaminase RidA (YjgF/YER057c/UK114 family)